MKRAIVVGSGAGGATVAKELAGYFDVTVLESGGAFRPLATTLPALEWVKRSHLLLDPRQIQMFYPAVRVRKTDGMFVVTGAGLGGSTTIGTGCALADGAPLKALGIDLDREFEETTREIPANTDHSTRWLPSTRRLFEICADMRLHPRPTPKAIDPEKCRLCGRCTLGCPRGAKWDSRRYLDQARRSGVRVLTGCHVERIDVKNGQATGVHTHCGLVGRFLAADLVVLAAGGLGTPAILQRSGIRNRASAVDTMLCVGAQFQDALQCHEIPLPFVVERPGYFMSPYFDLFAFLFSRSCRHAARHTVALTATMSNPEALQNALALTEEIFERMGAGEPASGKVTAAHPRGALALTSRDLHPPELPANVWAADASLLPASASGPQMLTIIALAKRIAAELKSRAG
jgi:choline dehydrogenase-like flavoprotein